MERPEANGQSIDRVLGPGALSRRFLALVRPERVVGLSKVRIGNPDGDGGYVMLDAFEGIVAALSVGIGADVSWDLDVANRGMEVFQYDHTVPAPPISHPRFRFVSLGIAESGSCDPSFVSLDEMVTAIPGDGDLIAKIDVEGAEWAALSTVSTLTMHRLAQLVVELHDPVPADGVTRLRHLGMLGQLALTHAVVHVHANNYAGVSSLDGIHVPDALELTYVRRTGLDFVPCSEGYPTTLDRPNNPDCADIAMRDILAQSGPAGGAPESRA